MVSDALNGAIEALEQAGEHLEGLLDELETAGVDDAWGVEVALVWRRIVDVTDAVRDLQYDS